MPDRDAFESAYGRLAATRLVARTIAPGGPAAVPLRDVSSPVRWAASRLLPRLDALAPRRRSLHPRLHFDE